ncbi:MAG: hypothetical protein WA117_15900 [Verrucomicrobiia bacterium]
MIKLKLIGFWSGGPETIKDPNGGGYKIVLKSESWIDPACLVDENCQSEVRPLLVSYLKKGRKYASYMGYSFCRFAGGPPNEEMGDSELTDGVWLWPEGLWIYVDKYKVRLPEEFVVCAKSNGFRIPKIDMRTLDPNAYDSGFWRDWCAKEKARYGGMKQDTST